MKELFYPSSVVVIGVSTKPFNLGKVIAWNLAEFGFKGEIHYLGIEGGKIFDREIHTSMNEIAEPIDLAIILTPAKTIPGIMEECGRKGIRRIIIESGGFGEFGDEGRRLSEELKRIAEKYGIRFIGPNCIGIMNSANGIVTPFAPMKNVFAHGGVGIIAQSGGVALSLLFMFDSEQLGYSKFATIGNKLDIDENDLLQFFTEDPDTKVICMYLESVKDGRRLTDIAKRSPKPIVVHKANIGMLSSVIAHSHTEALANDDQVVDAALRQAGIVRSRDMLRLMDFVKILQLPRMAGKNLAIVSRSGGHAVIAADAAQIHGFNLPPFREDFLAEIRKHLRADVIKLTNPLDLGDLFDFDIYVKIIEHTIQQEEVDGILFMHTSMARIDGESSRRLLEQVAELSKKYAKPVAVCVSAEQFEITKIHQEFAFPTFSSPERAVLALAGSIEYEERRAFMAVHKDVAEPDPPIDAPAIRSIVQRAVEEGRSPLLHEALDIIRSAGLQVPEHRLVRDPDSIRSEMGDMAGPYAAKVVSSAVSHKSDKGGVVLNLPDRDAVGKACREMQEAMGEFTDLRAEGVLVQRMAPRIPGSYELIVGGKRDLQFGPMVLVGHGGIFVEVFGKACLRMAPLSMGEIDEMIDELPGSEVLKGIRGLPPVDRAALQDAILRVARLMVDFPEIDQIDVNPVIVSNAGALAVDARIVIADDGSLYNDSRK